MKFKEFKAYVERVLQTLPEEFAPYMDTVIVELAEEPSRDFLLHHADLTEEEIDAGETILGLYEPLYATDDDLEGHMHRLWIFLQPHLDLFGDDPKKLRLEIRKTVIHELAHRFGFSEEDLARFESRENPFPDEIE